MIESYSKSHRLKKALYLIQLIPMSGFQGTNDNKFGLLPLKISFNLYLLPAKFLHKKTNFVEIKFLSRTPWPSHVYILSGNLLKGQRWIMFWKHDIKVLVSPWHDKWGGVGPVYLFSWGKGRGGGGGDWASSDKELFEIDINRIYVHTRWETEWASDWSGDLRESEATKHLGKYVQKFDFHFSLVTPISLTLWGGCRTGPSELNKGQRARKRSNRACGVYFEVLGVVPLSFLFSSISPTPFPLSPNHSFSLRQLSSFLYISFDYNWSVRQVPLPRT